MDRHPLKSVDLARVEEALSEAVSGVLGTRFAATVSEVAFSPPQESGLSQRFRLEISFSRPIEDWLSHLPSESDRRER
ncbi:MAG: hypothetical protein U1E65_11075 [Myxococcota bacterium]